MERKLVEWARRRREEFGRGRSLPEEARARLVAEAQRSLGGRAAAGRLALAFEELRGWAAEFPVWARCGAALAAAAAVCAAGWLALGPSLRAPKPLAAGPKMIPAASLSEASPPPSPASPARALRTAFPKPKAPPASEPEEAPRRSGPVREEALAESAFRASQASSKPARRAEPSIAPPGAPRAAPRARLGAGASPAPLPTAAGALRRGGEPLAVQACSEKRSKGISNDTAKEGAAPVKPPLPGPTRFTVDADSLASQRRVLPGGEPALSEFMILREPTGWKLQDQSGFRADILGWEAAGVFGNSGARWAFTAEGPLPAGAGRLRVEATLSGRPGGSFRIQGVIKAPGGAAASFVAEAVDPLRRRASSPR